MTDNLTTSSKFLFMQFVLGPDDLTKSNQAFFHQILALECLAAKDLAEPRTTCPSATASQDSSLRTTSAWMSTSALCPTPATLRPSARTRLDLSPVPARRPTWATPSRSGASLAASASTTATARLPQPAERAAASTPASASAAPTLFAPP